MTLKEFERIATPPLGFNPIPLVVSDVMLVKSRLKDEHGISYPAEETVRLLSEVEHKRVLEFCDKLEAIRCKNNRYYNQRCQKNSQRDL